MIFLTAVLAAAFEEVERPEYVDAGVVGGLADRAGHLDMGGVVHDHLGLLGLEHVLELVVPDVDLVESGSGGEVLPLAAGEVVDDGHVVAEGQERVADVRSDEPCPSGDQDLHVSSSDDLRDQPASSRATLQV